jgi:hypothetical protein
MSRLILPENVVHEDRLQRAMEEADSIIAETRYWGPLLHDIDLRLNIRKARAQAAGPGVIPGFWHVTRTSEGAAPTAWAITTNGLGVPGDYREMGHDVLETLRRGDLWSASRLHEAATMARRRETSKERAKETRREARVQDLALNVKALDSPGVSLAAKGATAKGRHKAKAS